MARRSRSLPIFSITGAIGVLLVIAGIVVLVVPALTPGNSTVFGVLQADSAYLNPDSAAGVGLAVINIGWDDWQPSPAQTNTAYVGGISSEVDEYKAAGWQVAVDIGLQSPPAWVLSLPGALLRDQRGRTSGVPAYEFSEAVRTAAASYMTSVVHALGGVTYYRVGLGGAGEALYPSVTGDGWWAYSTAAQGKAGGLPAGVTSTPLPGWIPGSTTYRGHPLGLQQVQAWYDWYFGAMVNALGWEIATYRTAGFGGRLELVMPGYGVLPDLYSDRIDHYLAPDSQEDPYGTVNTAAVWWRLLDSLPDLSGVVVDISSVYDPSGSPRGNVCTSADQKIDYMTNRVIDSWSDTRWLVYLARRHRLPVMGENGGDDPPQDLQGVFQLVRACRLGALQWAFEPQLHELGPYVNISQYASAIAAFRS